LRHAGGLSWFEDTLASSLTTNNINHIEVNLTDSIAVIVGDSGTVIYVARDSTVLDVAHDHIALPQRFELSQNYPNPFNPTTTIEYELPWAEVVSLKVYNILGEEVRTLVHERKMAGRYRQSLDGKDLASGVYLCRLTAGTFTRTRKLILLR
jgi:hypothetical protein